VWVSVSRFAASLNQLLGYKFCEYTFFASSRDEKLEKYLLKYHACTYHTYAITEAAYSRISLSSAILFCVESWNALCNETISLAKTTASRFISSILWNIGCSLINLSYYIGRHYFVYL
jgi:hypothetical protein